MDPPSRKPRHRVARRGVLVLSFAFVMVALPGYLQRREPAAPTPTPYPTFRQTKIRLTPVAKIREPVALAVRPNDKTLYVATKGGRVYALGRRQRVVLDLRPEVTNKGEQGMLGLTFTPNGKRMIVYYVDHNFDTKIRSYAFPILKGGGKELLAVDHPAGSEVHYGGQLAFGPDGYLYISLGDGGEVLDPNDRAQSLDGFFGKILRVDLKHDGTYRIPPDNPFAGPDGAKGEIWDYGLRNPWRFTFDDLTGDMWIADVGETQREEIDLEPAGSKGGHNYGWRRFEGTLPMKGDPVDSVRPVYEYAHRPHRCAVIGGYVYRGWRIPGLRGVYLFGDICGGEIEGLVMRKGRVVDHRTLSPHLEQLASFGRDASGELYALSLTKGVYRIDPA